MRRNRAALALTLSSLLLGSVAAPASAGGATRWVDDDGQAGPGGCGGGAVAATTIQAAIDASSAGGTVLVCPGEYREEITVGPSKDGLTLRSVTPFEAKVRQPGSVGGADSSLLEIVTGARDVTVRGFVFVARAPSEGTAGRVDCALAAAVWVLGEDAVVRGNRVRVTGESYGLCGYGVGILVGDLPDTAGTPSVSALVSHNLIRDFRLGGIVVVDAEATVERNSIRHWHLGSSPQAAGRRAAARLVTAARSGPAGPGASAAGIVMTEGARGTVSGNEVSSGPDAAFPAGITPILEYGIVAQDVEGVVIRGNTIRRAVQGIASYGTTDVRIRRNTSIDHWSGIELIGAFDNVVRGNQVGPGVHGLGVYVSGFFEDAADNRFIDNVSLGHDETDCRDDTSGEGTADTANTWDDNIGLTDTPEGLCGVD